MRRVMSLAAGVAIVVGLASMGRGRADPAQEVADLRAKPSPAHAMLKKDLGIWDAEVKTWMPGVEEPQVTAGTETNRMLGGLWLLTDFRTEFAGQPYRGHGVYGYDEAKKKYIGTWVDSMASSMMAMEGTYDEAKEELVMRGESVDPASNTTIKLKNVAVHNADGTRDFTMYMERAEAGGEPVKMMEIHYKKRADLPAGKKAEGQEN